MCPFLQYGRASTLARSPPSQKTELTYHEGFLVCLPGMFRSGWRSHPYFAMEPPRGGSIFTKSTKKTVPRFSSWRSTGGLFFDKTAVAKAFLRGPILCVLFCNKLTSLFGECPSRSPTQCPPRRLKQGETNTFGLLLGSIAKASEGCHKEATRGASLM